MADTTPAVTREQPPAPDAVAEVNPPTPAKPPEVKPEAPQPEPKKSLPGYPKTRWHPVHGRKDFADPQECADWGQDDERGDWRFKTSVEADLHRIDPEAGLAIAHNMRTKLAQHDEQGKGVVRNSASAQESLDSGHVEPL